CVSVALYMPSLYDGLSGAILSPGIGATRGTDHGSRGDGQAQAEREACRAEEAQRREANGPDHPGKPGLAGGGGARGGPLPDRRRQAGRRGAHRLSEGTGIRGESPQALRESPSWGDDMAQQAAQKPRARRPAGGPIALATFTEAILADYTAKGSGAPTMR